MIFSIFMSKEVWKIEGDAKRSMKHERMTQKRTFENSNDVIFLIQRNTMPYAT